MAVWRGVVCDGVVELEGEKGKLSSVRINYVLANVFDDEQKEEGETVRLKLGEGAFDNGLNSLHKKSAGGRNASKWEN